MHVSLYVRAGTQCTRFTSTKVQRLTQLLSTKVQILTQLLRVPCPAPSPLCLSAHVYPYVGVCQARTFQRPDTHQRGLA